MGLIVIGIVCLIYNLAYFIHCLRLKNIGSALGILLLMFIMSAGIIVVQTFE